MGLADELELVVLLHVPRAERLADPDIQRGVVELARRYPRASIVLAHCGRCYLPAEMQRAIASIQGLENVYLDTAMVMDPAVLRMVFENVGPRRVLFATDLPVAAMRGRRVHVMDHWVDLVLEGYPSSAYRVGFDGMRATFMTYEIAWSVILAAESAGLGPAEAQSRLLPERDGPARQSRQEPVISGQAQTPRGRARAGRVTACRCKVREKCTWEHGIGRWWRP